MMTAASQPSKKKKRRNQTEDPDCFHSFAAGGQKELQLLECHVSFYCNATTTFGNNEKTRRNVRKL